MGFILDGPCFKPERELRGVLYEATMPIRAACDQNRPALGVQLSPLYEARSKLYVFDLTAMICKEAKRRLVPAMHTMSGLRAIRELMSRPSEAGKEPRRQPAFEIPSANLPRFCNVKFGSKFRARGFDLDLTRRILFQI